MTDGIGAPLTRHEDERLLRGRGRFVADIDVPGVLHAAFLRSPHAHARIERIDGDAASVLPGVHAVFTARDLQIDSVGPLLTLWPVRGADGPLREPPRPALAVDRVRHVGEALAIALADDAQHALDALETIAVDYAPLESVVETTRALAPGSPQLHDLAPGNVAVRWVRGDASAVDKALAASAHLVTLDLGNQRLAGCAIEPRAVLAQMDGSRLVVHTSTQVPHFIRRGLAECLGMREADIRVIAPDVGGGFGYKGKLYPEEVLVAWAARKTARPVRWVASRNESFLADLTARDHVTRATLGLAADGRFLALRVDTTANLGAWVSTFGAAIPSAIYSALLAGPYRTPAIEVRVTCVFSNTQPTDAYRGAGRPEACFVLERLADEAARTLGIDRLELRRRNMIAPAAMPYTTPLGPVYDCGDFPRMLARASSESGLQRTREARRAAARARGRLYGIGFASFVESSGVAPSRMAGALGARTGLFESAEVRVDASGSVVVALGTHNHGQGHATTFAQIVASRLGIPAARVRIVEGDTDAVAQGTGTFGSRSIAVGGSALDHACAKVRAKATQVAAHLLEAAAADIEHMAGTYRVSGTDRSVGFDAIARACNYGHALPIGMEPGLHESAFYDPPAFAFSNGAHACAVEIDPETGVVEITDYYTVDDIGTVINPMIVDGQIHGGLAQGLGQALSEAVRFDPVSGQLLAGSFMDYALLRASDLPAFHCATDASQPCTHNPLGAKGCGESGAIGAPAALVSAALDALAPLGVCGLAMPLTPERVWRAIRNAQSPP